MKLMAIALVASSLFGSAAIAQTTVIQREAPDVVIERRGPPATVIEQRAVESTGSVESECRSKTVTKTNEDGDTKTVRKETCD